MLNNSYVRYTSDYWQIAPHLLEKKKFWFLINKKLKKCFVIDGEKLFKYLNENKINISNFCKSVGGNEYLYLKHKDNCVFMGKDNFNLKEFIILDLTDEMKIIYDVALNSDNKNDFNKNIKKYID